MDLETQDIQGRFQEIAERSDGIPVVAFWGSEQAGDAHTIQLREAGWHKHVRGQFFCVETGLARIRTASGSWLLPPQRVGWIPPGELHEVSFAGPLSGWGAMLSVEASQSLPAEACVMGVSQLLKALVRRAMTFASQAELTDEQHRIVLVLLDELKIAPREPLHLPMPVEPRLVRLAMHLLQSPHDEQVFAQLALNSGISERTARRLFRHETGMTFLQWRQQARLSLAIERLARGEPIAIVADALGYATPSNFIAMFRRTFSTSPGRYFAQMNASPGF
jgi:AraC-like DNA-binding protein